MRRPLSALLFTVILLGSAAATLPLTYQPASAAADYRITNLDGPSSATQGDTVTLRGTVVNVGNTSANKVVEFYVNGEVVQRERIQLDPNNRQEITVSYMVPQDTEGTVYFGITSNGNSLYESFTVKPDMEMTENGTMNMDKQEQDNMMNQPSNDGGSQDGRLDPQLAFIMIVIILLFVGGYVAYEIISGP